MLNYKKLSEEFTNKLNEYSKAQLKQWMVFDQNREWLSKLVSENKIEFELEHRSIESTKIDDSRETVLLVNNSFEYALAA
jgi:hypothetical protein